MIANVPVANIASNKYIVLSQKTRAIHNNKYNYRKNRVQINPKHLTYFGTFMSTWKVKKEWRGYEIQMQDKISSNLTLMHKRIYFLCKQ